MVGIAKLLCVHSRGWDSRVVGFLLYEPSCRMCYHSNFSVCAIPVFVSPAPVVDCCEDLSLILC